MSDLPGAEQLIRRADLRERPPYDLVTLTYDARFLRRKRLVTVHDEGFLVNLADTISVEHGDCFRLADGRLIEVSAAEEAVLAVTGDLARLAWHIGNRHTPCQIEAGRLVIRQDHVLEGMLLGLGALVERRIEPFTPEGGAYGHGRTMGHEHGPEVFGLHQHGDGQWHSHAAKLPLGHKDATG